MDEDDPKAPGRDLKAIFGVTDHPPITSDQVRLIASRGMSTGDLTTPEIKLICGAVMGYLARRDESA